MMKIDCYQAARYVTGKRSYVAISWTANGVTHRIRQYFDHIKHEPTRKKQALQYVREVNQRLESGWRPGDSENARTGFLLRDALSIVIEIKEPYARLRSMQSYRSHLKLLMEFVGLECGSRVKCNAFGALEARAVMDTIIRYRRPSGTTFNNYLTSYRGWFNELVRRGHYTANPFAAIKPLPVKRTENRAFTQVELVKVVDYLRDQDKWFLKACELLYYCGIRRSELVGLQVSALELNYAVINVPGHVAKNGHARSVAIPIVLRDELAVMLTDVPADWYLFGQGLEPCAEKAWPNRVSERWAKVRDTLKLSKTCKFYGLKDTAAERLLRSGVDISRIRDLYDHSDISITDAYLKKTTGKVDYELAANFPKMS